MSSPIPTLPVIRATVAQHFGFSEREVMSAVRQKDLVRARHVGCALARRLTLHGFPEIARAFGYGDHTSAMHGVKKIEMQAEVDRDLGELLDRLGASVIVDGERYTAAFIHEVAERAYEHVARSMAKDIADECRNHVADALLNEHFIKDNGPLVMAVAKFVAAHDAAESNQFSRYERAATRELERAGDELRTAFRQFQHAQRRRRNGHKTPHQS
ncbi:MAG: hypothetical protein JJ926_03935 [Roseitalea sp.]|nr:hypothetical protein [Roseitalea sp.]MBO6951007.1 hypothetical protein [Rhizobiaceae bacterium]MBO6591006.1 hypothetical protein [Roseitalea sp.]MBO6599736.1 hypothetical protein [Roseitalea sp.]MBO6611492.1 hypothetical protein [Roseitalea sp.]